MDSWYVLMIVLSVAVTWPEFLQQVFINGLHFNTFTAIVDFSRFNNSCLKSPASTLVDLTLQSRAPLFQLKSAT